MSAEHELAELYGLDALDTHEREAFEDHLAGCDQCRETVRQTRESVVDLASSPPVEPPAGLRTDVLAAVASAGPTDLAAARHRRQPVGRWLAAAAAVLVVLAAGIVWQTNGSEPTEQTAHETYTAIMDAPDHEVKGTSMPHGADFEVVMSHDEKAAMVVARGMRPAPPGMTYQVWAIDQTPVSAGLMDDAEHDGSTAMMALPETAMHASMVAMTIEPKGGSKQPTSDPIAVIRLS